MPRSFVIGCAITLASLLASSAFAQAPTPSKPPDHFTIDVVAVTGSGCGDPGDYKIDIAKDKTSFTVGYNNDSYSVKTGIDPATGKPHTIQDTRKNCLLGIRVDAPPGFTYGIAQADVRGSMSLRPNVNAVAMISFWFQGLSPTYPVAHYLRQSAIDWWGHHVTYAPSADTGAFSVDWETSDITDVASIVYNPCGAQRDLEVNTQLLVNRDTQQNESFAGVDATDGSILTVMHWAWATCP